MLTDNDDYIRVYYGEAVVCFATLLPILEDVMESATFWHGMLECKLLSDCLWNFHFYFDTFNFLIIRSGDFLTQQLSPVTVN